MSEFLWAPSMFKWSWQQDASSGIIPPKICCLVICCNSVCLKLQGGLLKEVLKVCHLLPPLGAVSIQYEEENAIESSVHRKIRIGGRAFPALF